MTTNINQRREDYALQVVPESFREWHWISLLGVILAGATSMFYFIFGANLVQTFGMKTFLIGIVVTTVFFGTAGFIFAIIASETGLDMDLITSGSGFGYKGAGFTSIIYALAYLIYFAIEGSIIASGIHAAIPFAPLWLLNIIIGAVFIPLTWYGMTAMNYVMWISLPIYITILIWSVLLVAHTGPTIHFWEYQPVIAINPKAGPAMLQFFAITSSMLATSACAADIGRFIPRKNKVIAAVAISYVLGISIIGIELLGAWFALKLGQSNPGVYFPALLGIAGTLFLIISQLRINVVNTYCGSLAFTTCFSRLFNFAPGRHWWVILLAVSAIILMFGNVLNHLQGILTSMSVFIFSWVMAVLSYIIFNHKLFKISSQNFHFIKGSIPEYNPIGLISLGVALITGISMSTGYFGPLAQTVASLTAGTISFIMVPIVTLIVRKYFSHVGVITSG